VPLLLLFGHSTAFCFVAASALFAAGSCVNPLHDVNPTTTNLPPPPPTFFALTDAFGQVKNLPPFPKRTCRRFSSSSTFQPLFSYEYIRKQWLGGGEGFDIAARGGGGGAVARTSSGATGNNQTLGGKGGGGGRKKKKTSGVEAAKGEGAAFKFRPARQAREDSPLEDEPNKAEQQQQQVPPPSHKT
jgi:hypothetical protein